AGAGAVIAALAVIVAAIYAFSWLFIFLGLIAGNAQAAQSLATLVVVPLTFVSGAFVPVSSMPAGLHWFAAHQPVTVLINAVRSLVLGGTEAAGVGHTTSYWVLNSLLWCAGIFALFSALTSARFARSRQFGTTLGLAKLYAQASGELTDTCGGSRPELRTVPE